jgi:hypothetical protein
VSAVRGPTVNEFLPDLPVASVPWLSGCGHALQPTLFPPAIIQYAVWLLHRFNLSHRGIEDLLADRGIE